jgi:hypothetical protein
MIFTVLGWLAALAATAATGYRAWFMRDALRDAGNWVVLLMWSALAVVMFTFLGVIGLLTGSLYTGAAAAVILAAGRVWTPEGRRALAGDLREGLAEPFAALRRLVRRAHGEEEPGETETVVAEHVASRLIPPVREDPALGLPPEPAVIASVPAPAPYAALAQFIGGFEPEDDQALTMFMQGHAAGGLVIADAWRHFADTCLNGAGLDPAYVAGILEVGDTEGESAAHKAQVHKRFGVIYQQVQEWISAGRMLPHKAREFLTGEGA